jgi:hypothetical protein
MSPCEPLSLGESQSYQVSPFRGYTGDRQQSESALDEWLHPRAIPARGVKTTDICGHWWTATGIRISGLNRTFVQIGRSELRGRNRPNPPGSQEVRGSNPLTSTGWACENCNVFPGQRACLRWDFQARQMPTFEPLPDQGERPNQASHPVKRVRLQWLHSALATSRQWSSTRTTTEIKNGPPPASITARVAQEKPGCFRADAQGSSRNRLPRSVAHTT